MSEFEKYYKEVAGIPTLDDESGIPWEEVLRATAHPNDLPVRLHGDQVIPHKGTYSDAELLVAIHQRQIMQYPQDRSLVNPASIDFRLGHYFYLTDQDPEKIGLYNPYDQEDIDRYFGESLEAVPLKDISYIRSKLGLQALKNIDPQTPIILLRPGERILAHSFDFMGIDRPGIGQLFATSTKARNGITIAQDSTFMNPGWKDRITLEIKNENEDEHVPLIVGDVVGQTVYHSAGPTLNSYETNGSYRDTTAQTHEDIVAAWRPERMKPKAKQPKALPELKGLQEGLK